MAENKTTSKNAPNEDGGAAGTDENQEWLEAARRAAIAKLPMAEGNNIGKVIAVMSGKGGVGKSSVTALLASYLSHQGAKVGVLDADVTGPSIPKLFGVHEMPTIGEGGKMVPPESGGGVKVMSLNLLLSDEEAPVIWRGPLVSGAIKQFWSEVLWGDLDYLIVDLPPGTGDAPLTVMQSLPLDGAVIVSTPQKLAAMVVKKAVNAARMLDIPILGLVENMSYVQCPDTGKRLELFGPSNLKDLARELEAPALGALPIDPALAEAGDRGKIEEYQKPMVDEVFRGLTSSPALVAKG